jgi:hypothetical protein
LGAPIPRFRIPGSASLPDAILQLNRALDAIALWMANAGAGATGATGPTGPTGTAGSAGATGATGPTIKNKSGLYTARGTATGTGTLYFADDQNILSLDDPTAVAWKNYPGAGLLTQPNLASGYTLLGAISLTQIGDLIESKAYSYAGNGNQSLIAGSLPQSTPWTVTLKADCTTTYTASGTQDFQLIVTTTNVSSTGIAYGVGATNSSSGSASIGYWKWGPPLLANGASPSPNPGSGFQWANNKVFQFRILNDGVLTHFQASNDGVTWSDINTIAAPASLGYYGWEQGSINTATHGMSTAVIFENKLGGLTVAQATITNVTIASPCVATTSGNHNFRSGDMISITGVTGTVGSDVNSVAAVGASSAWSIKVLSPTTFEIGNSVGSGSYTSGGTATCVSR